MSTLSIRIDDEIKARWTALAEAHGLNPSQHMRAAIIDRLEELEDYYVVKERLAEPFEAIPNAEFWAKLGMNEDANEG